MEPINMAAAARTTGKWLAGNSSPRPLLRTLSAREIAAGGRGSHRDPRNPTRQCGGAAGIAGRVTAPRRWKSISEGWERRGGRRQDPADEADEAATDEKPRKAGGAWRPEKLPGHRRRIAGVAERRSAPRRREDIKNCWERRGRCGGARQGPAAEGAVSGETGGGWRPVKLSALEEWRPQVGKDRACRVTTEGHGGDAGTGERGWRRTPGPQSRYGRGGGNRGGVVGTVEETPMTTKTQRELAARGRRPWRRRTWTWLRSPEKNQAVCERKRATSTNKQAGAEKNFVIMAGGGGPDLGPVPSLDIKEGREAQHRNHLRNWLRRGRRRHQLHAHTGNLNRPSGEWRGWRIAAEAWAKIARGWAVMVDPIPPRSHFQTLPGTRGATRERPGRRTVRPNPNVWEGPTLCNTSSTDNNIMGLDLRTIIEEEDPGQQFADGTLVWPLPA